MDIKPLIIITAGGTGGHVFPGIAIAHALQARGCDVEWIGRHDSKEEAWVKKAGIVFHGIQASALRGRGVMAKFSMPFKLLSSTREAGKILASRKPDAILGMGGYVAAPVGVAAKFKKIPLIIHDQNAVMGMTNKWLSKIAIKTLVAFEGVGGSNAEVVGNPVRADIVPVEYMHKAAKPMHVAIIGGSQGAKFLNERMPNILQKASRRTEISVTHQTGEAMHGQVEQAYQQAQQNFANLEVVPFVDDMGALFATADLFICRAGALTVAEVAKAGLPAIFVPYPHAVDDHQTRNAQALVDAGAAVMMQQRDFNADECEQMLVELADDFERRIFMADTAKQVFPSDSVEKIVQVCLQVVEQNNG